MHKRIGTYICLLACLGVWVYSCIKDWIWETQLCVWVYSIGEEPSLLLLLLLLLISIHPSIHIYMEVLMRICMHCMCRFSRLYGTQSGCIYCIHTAENIGRANSDQACEQNCVYVYKWTKASKWSCPCMCTCVLVIRARDRENERKKFSLCVCVRVLSEKRERFEMRAIFDCRFFCCQSRLMALVKLLWSWLNHFTYIEYSISRFAWFW